MNQAITRTYRKWAIILSIAFAVLTLAAVLLMALNIQSIKDWDGFTISERNKLVSNQIAGGLSVAFLFAVTSCVFFCVRYRKSL